MKLFENVFMKQRIGVRKRMHKLVERENALDVNVATKMKMSHRNASELS